jgi:catechol 2,3-dioxygenase-like lactoylglutathione lyase family enzyme
MRMPEAHAGRLIDHVHLRVHDLEASKRFYAAVADALDVGPVRAGDGWFSLDELFVSDDGAPSRDLHIAFQAGARETVNRFYEAALGAGGRDNGPPGERAYHPGYFGAYVLDPDGNNVEAVHHGPVERSAPSVVFRW